MLLSKTICSAIAISVGSNTVFLTYLNYTKCFATSLTQLAIDI